MRFQEFSVHKKGCWVRYRDCSSFIGLWGISCTKPPIDCLCLFGHLWGSLRSFRSTFFRFSLRPHWRQRNFLELFRGNFLTKREILSVKTRYRSQSLLYSLLPKTCCYSQSLLYSLLPKTRCCSQSLFYPLFPKTCCRSQGLLYPLLLSAPSLIPRVWDYVRLPDFGTQIYMETRLLVLDLIRRTY